MSIENKPIALVTGSPGAGKTALIVKFIRDAAAKGRPIYQVGIPELKISHIAPPGDMADWTELREDPDMPGKMLPYFNFPENSLVVLSEAQRLYRPRPSASKLPDYVAAFETCRHTGVTFILDTQHPDFIDSHIRKLIGQHIHLIDFGVLGRRHYEWPMLGSPEQYKGAPIKMPYKIPKEIFGLYKSSSLHIKRQYTLPPAVKMMAALVLVIAVGGYYAFDRMKEKFVPPEKVAEAKTASREVDSAPGQNETNALDPATMLMEFTPAVPGRPETAPAFDGLRQVANMPQVVGCIATASRCTCQNQQGLDAGLDSLQCRDWIANPRFDAYRAAPASVPGVVKTTENPANLPGLGGLNSAPVTPSPAV